MGGGTEAPRNACCRTPIHRFFFHEVTRRTRRECISGGSTLVGTILRHVLSSCGVETPQDKDVKDDFSTHVLKDVAICSNTFWILGLAQHDDANDVLFFKEMPLKQKHKNTRLAKASAEHERRSLPFGSNFPTFLCVSPGGRTKEQPCLNSTPL
jgi:hypothetical protein